jgi:hypothetical protein
MTVRVRINFAHGLGDATQFTVVLKHLRKYRPDWIVDVRCGRGKESALRGLCRRVYHDQEPEPEGPYDTSIDIGFYENYNKYADRPNSKVTNCLHEVFGLNWDAPLGRYEVAISTQKINRAARFLRSIGCVGGTGDDRHTAQGVHNAVIIHYEGNTSPSKKNLAAWQAEAFCELAIKCGRVPVILDWDGRSGLPDGKRIFKPDCGPDDLWGGFGSGDAEGIAALIACSEAYIGVDSGPGKVASSTETPTLICWRGHHPIQFHDPAPNTVHLVPHDHRRLSPCDGMGVADFFEANYKYLTYEGDHGLVAGVLKWLAEVLGHKEDPMTVCPACFILPNGIGDTMWAILKIRKIACGRPIDLVLSGNPGREIDSRAVPFLKRFPFVRSVKVSDIPALEDLENPTDSRGRYRYVSDGPRGRWHYLMPNRTLESGRRIEEWLPGIPVDWDVLDSYDWTGTERGDREAETLGDFCCFYLGPESGHTDEGHNWKWLWEPKDWVQLGLGLVASGLRVCVIGARYDRSFWERYVRPGVEEVGMDWADLCGELEIGETLALLRRAKLLVSYQCGLGIVNHYLGGKTVMWWRPEGDSLHPRHFISFSEQMKDAWIRPGWESNYMGLIYKQCSPQGILEEMEKRKWIS